MNPRRPCYPVGASPFFRLRTKAKLAELLGTDRTNLLRAIGEKSSGAYREWETRAKYPRAKHPVLQHKPRRIQEPTGDLLLLQERLNTLLSRIELPEYLHSARKGRSYRSNASEHSERGAAFRIDIKRFYESAQDVYVQKFFLGVMQCSADVAHLLTEIACFRRRLPTGSPLSPLISFLAYAPMFDEIASIATSVGATMTVYVDDIVLSGGDVAGTHVHECASILRKYELIGHKIEYFHRDEIRVITGLTVDGKSLGVTNKRKRKIRALREELARETDAAEKRRYGASLLGLLRESSSIDPSMLLLASRLEAEIFRP